MSRGAARWDTPALTIITLTAVLWIVGALMAAHAVGAQAGAAGLVLVVIAALSTALMVIRNWIYKLDRATIQGYHAGYHRAMQSRCTAGLQACDVLDMAEVRARRAYEMN